MESNGNVSNALRTYGSAFPHLAQAVRLPEDTELRSWLERILDSYCRLANSVALSDLTWSALQEALRAFRFWSKFVEQSVSRTSNTPLELASRTVKPRRPIWKQYYNLLSTILQRQLPYRPPSSEETLLQPTVLANGYEKGEWERTARSQQRAELQNVQENYERLLLHEVPFPKAHEFNEEIESWIEMVVGNWRIFCGSGWDETAMDEAGKILLGRGVLDVGFILQP